MRWFIPLLIIAAAVFGEPYAALLWNRAMGPWHGEAHHQDGSVTFMRFDQDMARPAWLTLPPGSSVVQAGQSTYSNRPGTTANVEILVRMPLDDLKHFFTDTLSRQGFRVTDHGLGALDQRTATFLGVFGEMTAQREETGEWVRVQFRDEQGVIPTRFVQVSWKLP